MKKKILSMFLAAAMTVSITTSVYVAGNTVIVIEHNLDVIKCADHIIDLGPEGGFRGGTIVATGTPQQIAQNPNSHTGKFLRPKLGLE